MIIRSICTTAFCLWLLASCMQPDTMFSGVPTPEEQVVKDIPHEKIYFSLTDQRSLNAIETWIAEDIPSYAEVSCDDTNALCYALREVLVWNAINFTQTPLKEDSTHGVSLYYNR